MTAAAAAALVVAAGLAGLGAAALAGRRDPLGALTGLTCLLAAAVVGLAGFGRASGRGATADAAATVVVVVGAAIVATGVALTALAARRATIDLRRPAVSPAPGPPPPAGGGG